MLKCVALLILGLNLPLFSQTSVASASETLSAPSDIYTSVVRIEASTQVPDYRTPWNSGRFSGGIGTGFLVGKNRFLTNAHVVSDARRLLITMHGSPQKHPARVLHIAHDCDLALLELEDFTAFEGLPYLKISGLPKLESQVRVIGYPVGGDRLSVTRGVVSRIDFRPYSHSILDSHLVIQIDAAINPGNSGGPVLQNGHVVGVAFQGLRSADNTGYMIPVPVIKRFLKDIEDGHYDRYVDLGIADFPLFNPAMRTHYGLPNNGIGTLVGDITVDSPVHEVIEKGDVLIAIDGKSIDSAGMVEIDGSKVNMNEIVERKFAGDSIELTIIRDKEEMKKTVTLKPFPPARIYAVRYGERPRYIVHAGLVLQPLTRNAYAAHSFKNQSLRYIYWNYTKEAIFEKRKDIVVLSRVLSDELTSHIGGFEGLVIDTINGTDVTDLKHAHSLLTETPEDGFLVITFAGEDAPLVLPGKKIPEANERIARQYNIKTLAHLEEN